MINKVIIKPLIGIDGLSLGVTKSEARNILGDPDKCSMKEYKYDKSRDEGWEYFQLGLELTFSSDDDWLLGTIGVTSEEATLAGHHLVGLDEKKLLKILDQIDIGPIVLESDFTELGSRDYVCDKYGLSFWVQDGVVTTITIIPDYDESGTVPLWPK